MTAENGNGELRQLLEIKRGYRKDLTLLQEELMAKFERELAEGKKKLKEQYLEQLVDAVFAEAPLAPSPAKPEPVEATALLLPESKCPECGLPVDPTDKFCAECASPLQDVMKDATVVSTGRKFRPRRR